MRKVMKNWQVIAMSMMVLFATSCEKNEGDDPAPSDVFGGKGNILIEQVDSRICNKCQTCRVR